MVLGATVSWRGKQKATAGWYPCITDGLSLTATAVGKPWEWIGIEAFGLLPLRIDSVRIASKV